MMSCLLDFATELQRMHTLKQIVFYFTTFFSYSNLWIGLNQIRFGFKKVTHTDQNNNRLKVKQISALFGSFLIIQDFKIGIICMHRLDQGQ